MKMTNDLLTIAMVIALTLATGCSTTSGNKSTTRTKVITPEQLVAESMRQEAGLHAEAIAPGMPRSDFRRMMVVINERKATADQELAEYEKFKMDQRLALAEASAPKITVINGEGMQGVPASNPLPGNYSSVAHYSNGESQYIRTSNTSPYPRTVQSVANPLSQPQDMGTAVAIAAPTRFYKRQALENSADRMEQNAARNAAIDAAVTNRTTTDPGMAIPDPIGEQLP